MITRMILGGLLLAALASSSDAASTRQRKERNLQQRGGYYYPDDDYFVHYPAPEEAQGYYYPDDDYYYYNEYYYGKGKGGKKSKKGKGKGGKGGKKSKKGSSDDFTIGNPRPTLALTGEAFSLGPLTAVVPDFADPDPLAIGTVYPFGTWTFDPNDVSVDVLTLQLEGQSINVWVYLDGYCTRTGLDDNSVEGYCHFTYSVFDPVLDEVMGRFAAEGPLANPNIGVNDATINPCTSLEVTGGTGLFIAVTGIVAFCPSVLNETFDPPLVESLPLMDDLFEDVDGYLHIIDMNLDEEFATMPASSM